MRALLGLTLLCLWLPGAPADPAIPAGERSAFAARRAALARWMAPRSLLVLGNEPAPGQRWPNRFFYHLTGLHDQRALLVVYRGEDGLQTLVALKPGGQMETRVDGVRPLPGETTARQLGVALAITFDEATKLLPELMPHVSTLYLDARRFPDAALGARLLALARARKISVSSPTRELTRLRAVKDAVEVAHLQRAIDITGCALVEAMRSIHPGQPEYALQAVIEYMFRRNGADERPAFRSIVGSGPNSCVIHYQRNRRTMQAGELVVIDVGAQVRGYAADVTRTLPVSGRFTPRQREIYDLVHKAQAAGFAAVKPGATLGDVHRAAHRVIARAGYARYFFHSTSHWLGLDVHDPGNARQRLVPGMVLTVEPGIYIARERLGVRIEDDVLVTRTGHRVLSGWIPRAAADVERWIARGEGLGRVRRELERERLGLGGK